MGNGLPEIISIWNEVVEEGIEIIKYTGGWLRFQVWLPFFV
jgi:hypothetical protein